MSTSVASRYSAHILLCASFLRVGNFVSLSRFLSSASTIGPEGFDSPTNSDPTTPKIVRDLLHVSSRSTLTIARADYRDERPPRRIEVDNTESRKIVK